MKKIKWIACLPLVLVSTFFYLQTKANAADHSLEWTRQQGTNGNARSQNVSSGGLESVYISGYSVGDLNGPTTPPWNTPKGTPCNAYCCSPNLKAICNATGNGRWSSCVRGCLLAKWDPVACQYRGGGLIIRHVVCAGTCLRSTALRFRVSQP